MGREGNGPLQHTRLGWRPQNPLAVFHFLRLACRAGGSFRNLLQSLHRGTGGRGLRSSSCDHCSQRLTNWHTDMSLLDEWNSEITTTDQLRPTSTAQSAGVGPPSDALFGLEQRAEFLCRCCCWVLPGRG